MTLTAHISAGSAVAVATGNPVLGFFAGLISHHLLDAVPHSDLGSLGGNIHNILKDRKNLLYVFADIFIGLIVFIFIAIKIADFSLVFWSVGGAILPDVIDNSPFWSVRARETFLGRYYHKLHETVHFTITNKKYFYLGLLTQLAVILFCLYYVFIKT
ncbi:MAG: hypothetical protein BWY43_00542 [candidate division WS2 bacterium ADurb.Bin280]|uniref:Inner membrane protein n=1 Tax=candidate division WS2 bacterium ADurb.Bin280 TaxID=1852829 RepID=A0A1V5SCZ6_9BACT|nr:MAG: hypothetical protein BWY43_00542 [candidate division WS2 bacterium ADurb.Bin280]